VSRTPWPQPPKKSPGCDALAVRSGNRCRQCPPFANTALGAAAKAARTTQIDNHGIRAARRLKRGGHKCSRTEIEKSAYTEEKAGDETEIDQSFA
jgi:hypothetical protein